MWRASRRCSPDGSIVEFRNAFDVEQAPQGRAGSIARECWSLLTAGQDVIDKALPATPRNRCGYNIAGVCHDNTIDLARLLAGSEGTLAVFTSITLRTVPLPAAKGLLQLEFDSLDSMARAVPTIIETDPTACELMDQSLIRMAIDQLPQYRDILPAGAAAVLLVEHVGASPAEVREKIEATDRAVGKRATGRTIITEPKAQARVWKSRKDAGPLLYRKRRREASGGVHGRCQRGPPAPGRLPGRAARRSRRNTASRCASSAMPATASCTSARTSTWAIPRIGRRCSPSPRTSTRWPGRSGGTISGEHAVGLIRAGFVRRQYGDEYYDMLKKVKKIFDPAGLMNPGKILNDDPDVMFKRPSAGAAHPAPSGPNPRCSSRTNELELEFEQCYGCGLCLGREPALRMCPVFRATGEELGSSRAKANLLHYWATGQLEEKDFESPEFRKFLDLCVNCKMCERQCPSGVNVSTLMAAARAEYVRRKGLRRTEFVLSRNRYLSRMGSAVRAAFERLHATARLQMAAGEESPASTNAGACPRSVAGSFLRAGRKYLAACGPIAEPVDKVAYFVDTYANFNDHELGFAVVDVLRHNGVEVILPDQRPAPLPAIVYGDVRTARRDLSYSVKHLAEAVRQGYKIVCSEPSAALCLREELRHYVAGEDASLVSQNTCELMNYLLALRGQGKLKAPTAVHRRTNSPITCRAICVRWATTR